MSCTAGSRLVQIDSILGCSKGFQSDNWLRKASSHDISLAGTGILSPIGQEEKSIDSYRKLLEYCPETLMANYYMGIALKASGKYDEAIIFFEKLLHKTDNHVSALYHLGRTYMKNYNYEKAKVYFKQALDLDPQNKNAAEMLEYLLNS